MSPNSRTGTEFAGQARPFFPSRTPTEKGVEPMNEHNEQRNDQHAAEARRVWVIATGQYDETTPVAAVHGTAADAERYADRYNAHSPWRSESDKAHIWCDVDYVGPETGVDRSHTELRDQTAARQHDRAPASPGPVPVTPAPNWARFDGVER